MKETHIGHFYNKLIDKREQYLPQGHIELTYRCNLDCIHCFCKGLEDKDRELTTKEWKRILDKIQKEGCFWICFTGGEALIRDDFLELYSYAKKKGFLITLFSNGLAFSKEIIDYLKKSPPFYVEITLNGITKQTYESITQTAGAFDNVMKNIQILAKTKIDLILKTNCLKQNKHEIGKIKAFTEELLGKPSQNRHHFKYDTMIMPRINGDKAPCNYRLSCEELLEVKKQDPDMWDEYKRGLHVDIPNFDKEKNSLYFCNSWMSQFFINPYGKLKFCEFSEKFSVDLKKEPFKKGFHSWPNKILNEKFKTDSKCKTCSLRPVCSYCPAKAYLETGNEESPVPYYCDLAEAYKACLEEEALD